MRVPPSMRLAPLTVALVWAACVVFAAVEYQTYQEEASRNEIRRRWGAVVTLGWKTGPRDGELKDVEGLYGPLEIWNAPSYAEDGQIWRLLVNPLHHANLLHLLFNGWAMLYLGRILERRMGWWATLLFLVGSAAWTVAGAALVGETTAIGLSGMAYAQVGLLMVWRDKDEEVAEEFPIELVVFAGTWLIICQVLTYTGIVPIANGAHYSGLIYGWLWGQAALGQKETGLFRFLFVVGHLALIPVAWFIMHPFWSGTYNWYLSHQAGITLRRKAERLQTAIIRDPGLDGAWQELVDLLIVLDERPQALRAALEGLRANRAHPTLFDDVVEIWLEYQRTNLQNEQFAVDTLQEVFGEEAPVWLRKIRAETQPVLARRAWTPAQLSALLGVPPEFDVTAVLPPLDERRTAPEVDPDAPDSALTGSSM